MIKLLISFCNLVAKEEKYDATGRKVYIAACKCLDITPASFFLKNIEEKHLDFKHRLLGPKGARALAAALEVREDALIVSPAALLFISLQP